MVRESWLPQTLKTDVGHHDIFDGHDGEADVDLDLGLSQTLETEHKDIGDH